MVWLVCAVLAAGAIGFTLFVRQRDVPPAPVENPELKHLETKRQVLYDNLKDLQFEYHQGKLSEEDYQSLKSGFLGDLAGMMEAIERLQQEEAKSPKLDLVSGGEGSKTKDDVGKQESGAPPSTKQPGKITRRSVRLGMGLSVDSEAVIDSVQCPSCQAENQPDHRFCGKCGKALAP